LAETDGCGLIKHPPPVEVGGNRGHSASARIAASSKTTRTPRRAAPSPQPSPSGGRGGVKPADARTAPPLPPLPSTGVRGGAEGQQGPLGQRTYRRLLKNNPHPRRAAPSPQPSPPRGARGRKANRRPDCPAFAPSPRHRGERWCRGATGATRPAHVSPPPQKQPAPPQGRPLTPALSPYRGARGCKASRRPDCPAFAPSPRHRGEGWGGSCFSNNRSP